MSGMQTNTRMAGRNYKAGSFSGTTAFPIDMIDAPLPCTVWVRPSAGTVTVSYSVDGGTNYTTVSALSAAAAYADTSLTGPVTHLKFVGDGATAAGTWGVC
jgi:hypothetical protein